MSGSLPIASFSPDGAVRLPCIVSCMFSAVFLHTDDAVVMKQGGASTQHAAVKLWYVVEQNHIDTVAVVWFVSLGSSPPCYASDPRICAP